PGNLRELDNVVRRAYALALNDIQPGAPVVLRSVHLEAAFGCDQPEQAALVAALRAAAAAFVDEAHARQQNGSALDLDLTDAFRGIVLDVATRRFGREGALVLFGKENLVANRNHHKVLRRELGRA